MTDDLFIPVPPRKNGEPSDADRAELGRRGADFRQWRGDARKIVYQRVDDQPLRISLEFLRATFEVDRFFAQHLWVKVVTVGGHAWLMKTVGVSPQSRSILLEPREAIDLQTSNRWEQSGVTSISEIQMQVMYTNATRLLKFSLLN